MVIYKSGTREVEREREVPGGSKCLINLSEKRWLMNKCTYTLMFIMRG